jgi:CheY-like chemotaxis protein
MPSQEWRSQVKQELASLRESALGAVANVGETLRAVVELEAVLASKQGIRLALGDVGPDLYAAIHPSALRQVLITALGRLTQAMSDGEISLLAKGEGGGVRITALARPVGEGPSLGSELVQEILAAHGGAAQLRRDGDQVSFEVNLLSVDEITVLVIDDNTDLVHFYRRYATGTRYRITHIAEGQRVFPVIEQSPPDVVVLDVMLPDIDGWELLVHLHEHPGTRSIPIVVCSVVREEELALALGAALYLPKPVRRQAFIEALNRALSPG